MGTARAPKPTYRHELRFITPNDAKELREASGTNRRLRPGLVQRYSRSMLEGRWDGEAPSGIVIDKTGKLRDGQHRLAAIERSGVGQWLMVYTCVVGRAFAVMDSGARRSAADVLRLDGSTYAAATASACKYALNYIDGVNLRAQRDADEILTFRRDNPAIEGVTASAFVVKDIFGPSPFAAVLFLAGESLAHADKIETFIAGVVGAADVSYGAGDPRRLLRDWAAREKARPGQVVRPEPQMMATALAWNAWATNQPLASVRDLTSRKLAHRDTMTIVGWPPLGGYAIAAE